MNTRGFRARSGGGGSEARSKILVGRALSAKPGSPSPANGLGHIVVGEDEPVHIGRTGDAPTLCSIRFASAVLLQRRRAQSLKPACLDRALPRRKFFFCQ